MRRFLIFLALVCFWPPAFMLAQGPELNISKAFSARFRDMKGSTETVVEKDKLRNVEINRYHSLTITDNPEAALEIERMVLADGSKASGKEVRYKSGHLYYGFYTLRPLSNRTNRYIIFLNGNLANNKKMVLLYIEGHASSEQVKKMLK